MISRSVYVAKDGREFPTEEDCLKYEVKLGDTFEMYQTTQQQIALYSNQPIPTDNGYIATNIDGQPSHKHRLPPLRESGHEAFDIVESIKLSIANGDSIPELPACEVVLDTMNPVSGISDDTFETLPRDFFDDIINGYDGGVDELTTPPVSRSKPIDSIKIGAGIIVGALKEIFTKRK